MAIFQAKPPEEKTKRPALGEIGSAGTVFFSGVISPDDYNKDLSGQKGRDIYDKMRLGDSQIAGTLLAVTLPIRRADWFMDPASDSPEDVEIAEIIQENLLSGMTITWDNFLRQALNMLPLGFSMFEKVWEYDDKKQRWKIRKLAPRLQKTLWQWYRDENGGIKGIQQYAINREGAYAYNDIPIDKLLVFVNEQEGDNFEGKSILRGAYRNWFYKNELYKVDGIGHDRFSSGVPVAKAPENPNPTDLTNMKTMLEELYSRERSYVIVPFGWDLTILEKTRGNESIMASVGHHNEEMAKNILAQFINLGTSATGSRALGESFEELFLMAMNGVADAIADTMNRYLIREYVDYNWHVEEYPTLKHGRISLNVTGMMNAIAQLLTAGGLSRGLDIENSLRRELGLPEKDEAKSVVENPEPAKEVVPPEEGEQKNQPEQMGEKKRVQLKERKRRRQLTELETRIVDFDEIEYTLDEGAARIGKVIDGVREKQVKAIVKEAVKKDRPDLKVEYIGIMADRIFGEMERLFKRGKKQVDGEIERQEKAGKVPEKQMRTEPKSLAEVPQNPYVDYGSVESIMKFMRSLSKKQAQMMANSLVNTTLYTISELQAAGVPEDIIEEELYNTVSKIGVKEIGRIAESGANVAMSMGREYAGTENKEMIEYAVRSVVLDGNACDVCLPKDQVRHEVGDPEFMTPDPHCLGGTRCRCVNIYKLEGMEGDFETKSKADYEKDRTAIAEGEIGYLELRDRYEEGGVALPEV